MDISKYEIKIKRHALFRAIERNIDPDDIEDILKRSKIRRFGKHGAKFVCKGNKRTIICVGEIVGMQIKIITLVESNKKWKNV